MKPAPKKSGLIAATFVILADVVVGLGLIALAIYILNGWLN